MSQVTQVSKFCQNLRRSPALHFLIKRVLEIGNFMNVNAASAKVVKAFDLASLTSLITIRSPQRAGFTLLHYVLEDVENAAMGDCSFLNFETQVPDLDLIGKADIDTLPEETLTLCRKARIMGRSVADFKIGDEAMQE
jgi:hypothetical protein